MNRVPLRHRRLLEELLGYLRHAVRTVDADVQYEMVAFLLPWYRTVSGLTPRHRALCDEILRTRHGPAFRQGERDETDVSLTVTVALCDWLRPPHPRPAPIHAERVRRAWDDLRTNGVVQRNNDALVACNIASAVGMLRSMGVSLSLPAYDAVLGSVVAHWRRRYAAVLRRRTGRLSMDVVYFATHLVFAHTFWALRVPTHAGLSLGPERAFIAELLRLPRVAERLDLDAFAEVLVCAAPLGVPYDPALLAAAVAGWRAACRRHETVSRLQHIVLNLVYALRHIRRQR